MNNMNNNNINLSELLNAIIKNVGKVVNPTGEPFIFQPINNVKASEPLFKTPLPTKPRRSLPVKALFNLKTEDSIPVLDDNGQPIMVKGEKGEMRVLRRTVKLDKPVLATKVFFDDGTWTVVKNTGEDEVELVRNELEDGNVVLTASTVSKERALAYAIVKHVFGTRDPETNEVRGADLNSLFDKVLAASIDQGINCAMSKSKKKKARAAKKTQMKFENSIKDDTDECCKKEIDDDLDVFKNVSSLLSEYIPDIENLAKS